MSALILPEPPEELKRLSRALCEVMLQRIADEGAIGFAQFMEMALYESGLGYYSAGLQKFGADGDFVTAPELGRLFGGALASQVDEISQLLPGGEFDILEIGAGTGQLASALVGQLRHQPSRYLILEPGADLRDRQRQTVESGLAAHATDVEFKWLDQPPDEDWNGIVIANEVLDALPVERFRVVGGEISTQKLAATQRNAVDERKEAAFADLVDWRFEPADSATESAVKHLIGDCGADWGDGYTSEISLNVGGFLRAISSSLRTGAVLLIDYGYPRREYYLPQRCDGTLVCHYRHRAHDNVLFYPGLQDLTAFVDFTAVAEAADDCGLALAGYTSQAMFLLGCGIGDLLTAGMTSPQNAGDLQAEARQLLMPGEMGERFQVMALSRGLNLEKPLRGFSIRDLSHRLQTASPIIED